MADEQSTETADVAEATEVESAEVESTDDENDVSLEDIEVTPEELGEDPEIPTEESEEDEETDSESEETEEESTDEDAEDTEETPELSEEEQVKAHNREMAQRRLAEKQQREALIAEQQQEYVAAAEDEKELALRQLQVDAYNNKVVRNTDRLTTQYERAIKDFDILNSKDPAIVAEVDAALDAFQAMYVSVDAYNNPTDVRGDLYSYLQTKADSISRLSSLGAKKQSTSKAKEKSKAMATPNRAPKEPKVDDMVDAFDEEASKY